MTLRNLVLASLSCSTLLGGCRAADDEIEAFRRGVPREETVAMKVPASGGDAKSYALETESGSFAVRGQTADTYKLTRGVSVAVNGGGALVLAIVKLVVSHRPTTLAADTAVWGPWNGGPLDPLTYKVTVKRIADHKYDYVFEGRGKLTPAAPFVAFLTGTHQAGLDASGDPMEGFGDGTFTLDWDARATLPAPGDEVGKVTYVYARTSPTSKVDVKAQFRQVKDKEQGGKLVDVDYVYGATPGAGGGMEFVHSLPASMANQGARWSVKSRWQESGAGRTDIKASGGMLPAGTEVKASECWSSSFASMYLTASWAPGGGYGDENTDCAFKPAEYSSL